MKKRLSLIITYTLLLVSCVSFAYETEKGYSFNGLRSKSAHEIRFLWWNIMMGGSLAKNIEVLEGHDPLENNLRSLTEAKNKPEFLALGEYRPAEVKPSIDQLIKSRYRNSVFIPNPSYPEQGILILSDLEMKVIAIPVGWDDPFSTPAENVKFNEYWKKIHPGSATYFKRNFIAVEYFWNGKKKYFLPFHSVQPWNALKTTYPEHFETTNLAKEIIFGKNNPLYHQLTQYKILIKAICPPDQNDILVMGDFNIPDQMIGVLPAGYLLLKSELRDTFRWASTYTYPTPSSLTAPPTVEDKLTRVKIDHAMVSPSQKARNGERLPLRGSDHFPITVILQ